jgi:hypothetical protein
MIKLGAQEFVKSSYSATGNCVVVGSDRPTAVKVGDSKPGVTPVLTVSPDAFSAFVSSVK